MQLHCHGYGSPTTSCSENRPDCSGWCRRRTKESSRNKKSIPVVKNRLLGRVNDSWPLTLKLVLRTICATCFRSDGLQEPVKDRVIALTYRLHTDGLIDVSDGGQLAHEFFANIHDCGHVG